MQDGLNRETGGKKLMLNPWLRLFGCICYEKSTVTDWICTRRMVNGVSHYREGIYAKKYGGYLIKQFGVGGY
jgi:hypothetical protein